MRRRIWRVAAVLACWACWACWARVAAPASAQEADEVAALVERLRTGDDAARTEALERLGEVASERPGELRRWLADPDPDIRFQVLFLLNLRDARTERRVRQIVEGRSWLAATFPQALEARVALLASAERESSDGAEPGRTLEVLVRVARQRGGGGDLGARYVGVALDLVAEIVEREAPAGRAGLPTATLLATLLDVDLQDGLHELCVAFAALPPDAALGALRAVIGGQLPMAQARAARVLGEIADLERADSAATAIKPLLSHALPEVRLAALRALGAMPLEAASLVPAGTLAQDPDPRVAEEALRLAGERGLGFAREPAERIAADARLPLPLRRQAVRTLGLLGNPGSAVALRELVRGAAARELRILAAWALGAVRAEDAVPALQGLLGAQDLQDEGRLYAGLARAGLPGVEALVALSAAPPVNGVRPRRARAIEALGLAGGDVLGAAAAVAALSALSRQPLTVRPGDGGMTESELERIARALGDLARDCEDGRAALARLVLERPVPGVLDALLPIVGEVGPPLDPALQRALTQALVRLVNNFNPTLRPLAAQALLRVNPTEARAALVKVLAAMRDTQTDETLELMRILARAGDASAVRQHALPRARAQLEGEGEEGPDQRFSAQNRLGIDLLYANQLDEAILEFRRMLWCRPTDSIPSYNVACGYALARRTDDALRYLRRAIRHNYRNPVHMAGDPDLDALHADPRFQRTLARLRLEEETGVRGAVDAWPRRPIPD